MYRLIKNKSLFRKVVWLCWIGND